MTSLDPKRDRLTELLREMDTVVVAYSGGVDSTFLAVSANDALGHRALAVTAVSPSLPPLELDEAVDLARRFGLHHRLVHTEEVQDPRYAANGPRRCYFCKVELYTQLQRLADDQGYAWIATGTNVDDLRDFRPGLVAGRERGVRDPLVEAGLTKDDIRALSRARGLPTWDKPAQACLSSRIPFGTTVTVEALTRIGRAEAYLRGLGFRQVRVRHAEESARIEVDPEEVPRLAQKATWEAVTGRLRDLGYASATIDPEGYRTGSLNAGLRRFVGKRP